MTRPWYVAPALDELRDELNRRHPDRDRSSDGAIGDPAHAARKSDHNPDPKTGVVRARDFDVDGIDVDALVAELLADDRVAFVIYDRRIAKRAPGGFRWEPYYGINPHTGHVHVSVRVGPQYENDTRPWFPQEDDDMYTDADRARDQKTANDIANVHASLWSGAKWNGKTYPGLIPFLSGIVGAIWRQPIKRDGQPVAVVQELADVRTEQIRQAAVLERIEAALTPKETQ